MSSRREFLQQCSLATLGTCAALAGFDTVAQAAPPRKFPTGLHEASFYTKLPDNQVQCTLCPCSPVCSATLLTDKRLTHACNGGKLVEGQTCVCHVRVNRGGTLYATNYGRATVLRQDPIEKNPLHHFLPGLSTLTIAAPGCSLACKGCQNWQVALAATEEVETVDAPPEKVVALAKQERCGAIAYTYTEPMMYYEYMTDIARLAKAQGLRNTVVTGGYVNPAPIKELSKVVDAYSVSVKAFDDQTYIDYARGTLTTIKQAMLAIRESGRWLEVVVLVIPTISDNLTAMQGFVRWVKSNLGADTPMHFSRFWPSYKLKNLQQTPYATLEKARAMALSEGMRFVYVGNLPGHAAANTLCPSCKRILIRRVGFTVAENRVQQGACGYCRTTLPGVWG